ncbi:uncharacterized protein [Diadema setosum]|uniref:uncharacterized protein n=1 Tax=Diadema setosum TaxID=31175 RepID=UPI003B3A265E
MSSPQKTSVESSASIGADAMAQLFKQVVGLTGIPMGRLSKFRGPPYRSGEPSLTEWIEEFEEATGSLDLSEDRKARVLIDYLAGPAREEVMCLPETERLKPDSIKEALRLCFGQDETFQSLSSAFHARKQKDGESLSEFSRSLLRMYGRMEAAADTKGEVEALGKLRDKALCDQLVQGAREQSVRRELRRIQLASESKGFTAMRREALLLFQEAEPAGRTGRIREIAEVTTQQSFQQQLVDSQRELASVVTTLKEEVANLRSEIQVLHQSRPRRKPLSEVECHQCGQKGHYKKQCPQGREQETQNQGN